MDTKIQKEKGCMTLYKVRKIIRYFALILLLLQTLFSTPLSASANGLETSSIVTSEEEIMEPVVEVDEPIAEQPPEEEAPIVEDEQTTVEPIVEKVEITEPTTVENAPKKEAIIEPQQEAVPVEKEEKSYKRKLLVIMTASIKQLYCKGLM